MYPEHLRHFDYRGLHRYFLTFCTFERQPHFVNRDHVELVLSQILRTATEKRFTIIAYCFMPDHLHLLIAAQAEDADARHFIKTARQCSGFHFKREFRRHLWQRYGYERTLRSDEASLGVARYVIENPLRAGLVDRVEDYPFAGSAVYALREILDSITIGASWSR